jgi:lipopolysaccharide/colanic/teichoic acid biosynthesis glycosyltransferase
MKRLLDCTVALLGLIVLAPVFAVLATLILAQDGRPVFFRQARVGRGGRDFRLIKFRTMRGRGQDDEGMFDAGASQRVFPIGVHLRRWKLDELPQLWNVLTGDMALVGPRPEVRQWVQVYPERWAKVLTVRPGITDPASIEFRDEEELLAAAAEPERMYREVILPRKLDLYERYVATHSIPGDLMIICETLWAMVHPRRHDGSAGDRTDGGR